LAAAGCVAIGGGAILAWFLYEDIKTTFIFAVGLTGILGLCYSLLILYQPDRQNQKKELTWEFLLIGLIGLDLLIAGWGLNPTVEMAFYDIDQEVSVDGRYLIPERIEYDVKFNKFFKFDTFYPDDNWNVIYDHLLPNTMILHRVEMVNNFDPIVNARYQRWIDEINRMDFLSSSDWQNHPAIQLMALEGISLVDLEMNPIINQNPGQEYPRIFITDCPIYIKDEEKQLEFILRGEISPTSSLVISSDDVSKQMECSKDKLGEYIILNDRPGYVKVATDLQSDAYVVWSQAWYPGWITRIDGEITGQSERANYLFQAARVPKGEHEVEFVYSPYSFKIGLSMTIATILLTTISFIQTKKD
jgi:hypothetical protein